MKESYHWQHDRIKRQQAIARAGGDGNPIATRVISGSEVHILTSNAIIVIYNPTRDIIITRLMARPGQVRKFYQSENEIPLEVLEKARQYQKRSKAKKLKN